MTISGSFHTPVPTYVGMGRPTSERPTFEKVYAEHFSDVWGVVCRQGVPARHRDDAMQEAWIAIHRALDRSEPGEIKKIRPWLKLVALRAVRDARSRHGKDWELLVPTDEIDSRAEAPIDETARDRELCRRFLESVDRRYREVLTLHDIEDMPMADVAAVLGIPLNTAHKRRRLGIEQLRKEARRQQAADRHRTPEGVLALLAAVRADVPPVSKGAPLRVWDKVQERLALEPPPPSVPGGPALPGGWSGSAGRISASLGSHLLALLVGAAVGYAALRRSARAEVAEPPVHAAELVVLPAPAPVVQASALPARAPTIQDPEPAGSAESVAPSARSSIERETQMLIAARVDAQRAAAANEPEQARTYLRAALRRLTGIRHESLRVDRDTLRTQVGEQMRALSAAPR
jgi:RNA polymerase sigma-70 factor (ECF subfamily)